MKSSNYLIKIEEPCAESWDTMSPADSGRFCASCAKNVIDFTSLSDDQVLAILKKPGGNLCGRLEEGQLNRFLIRKTEPSNKARFLRYVAGLFLLTAGESQAQEMIVREPMAMVKPPTDQERIEQERKADPNYSLQIHVSGQVISAETKLPVAGAWVMDSGNGNGYVAITDSTGHFTRLVPDSLNSKPSRFTVMHPEVGQKRFIVTAKEFPDVIELPPFGPVKVISGGGLTVVKRKWWQRRKKFCK